MDGLMQGLHLFSAIVTRITSITCIGDKKSRLLEVKQLSKNYSTLEKCTKVFSPLGHLHIIFNAFMSV